MKYNGCSFVQLNVLASYSKKKKESLETNVRSICGERFVVVASSHLLLMCQQL